MAGRYATCDACQKRQRCGLIDATQGIPPLRSTIWLCSGCAKQVWQAAVKKRAR